MHRVNVISSNIRSAGFDTDHCILEIEFHKSGIYQYINVPYSVFEGLLTAGSVGRYFNQHVRNRYSTYKVGE